MREGALRDRGECPDSILRLSQKDLEALQTLAVEEGIPYQTLIASILHKYVAGSFVERDRLAMSRR